MLSPSEKASWPHEGPIDQVVLKQAAYLGESTHNFRLKKDAYMNPKKGQAPSAPSKATIIVAQSYPSWMEKVLILLRPFFAAENITANNLPDDKDIIKVITSDTELKKQMKQVMAFVTTVKEDFKVSSLSTFDLKMAFDEKHFFQSQAEFLVKNLAVKEIEVQYATAEYQDKCRPSKPFIFFS